VRSEEDRGVLIGGGVALALGLGFWLDAVVLAGGPRTFVRFSRIRSRALWLWLLVLVSESLLVTAR